jgi:glycerophosphoryl diester phosphodiesterase
MKIWILILLTAMNLNKEENKTLDGQCSIIGHRGAPGYGGENTLWGFQKALDLGADGFELDVIPSKDGKLIVGHDFDLDRLIGKDQLNALFPGRKHDVTEYNLSELQTLKVTYPAPGEERYDYMKLSQEYRMPTLDEALDLLLKNRKLKTRNDLKIYIEIKTKEGSMNTISLNEISAQVTEALKQRDLLGDKNVWIQSFDYDAMDVIATNPLLKDIPKCQLGFGGIRGLSKFTKSKKARKFLNKKIVKRNLQMFHIGKVPAKYILENKKVQFIQEAHEMGIPIHLYTFRDGRHEEDYKAMSTLGVKGFTSDQEELIYFMEKGVDAVMTDFITSSIEARKKALSTEE